jgi:hypothetical protein
VLLGWKDSRSEKLVNKPGLDGSTVGHAPWTGSSFKFAGGFADKKERKNGNTGTFRRESLGKGVSVYEIIGIE